MALILNIETATKNCSVSLAENGKLIAIKELNDSGYSHAEKLHLFIEKILKDTKVKMSDLDAVAVSKGPGSYTGLRIGVSTAKGICFAINKPLISVETLKTLSLKLNVEDAYVVPMLDARRMEVYSAVYKNNVQVREIKAEIIDEFSFKELLEKSMVYFIGDGAKKCEEPIKSPNAKFIVDVPSSKEMILLSYQKFMANDFEDLAYFEPFYLKDFVVTPAKKKI